MQKIFIMASLSLNILATSHYPMHIPTIETMSTREKIGQLFMVATIADPDNKVSQDVLFHRSARNIPSVKQENELYPLLEKYKTGGILFLGNSTAEKQYTMTQRLTEFNKSHNRIPLLFGLDAEWGPAMRLTDAIKFPFNLTLGATEDIALVEEIGNAIGNSLRQLGVGINFAPVADCNTNAENPVINRRSFGQSPDCVAQYVKAYARGFQKAGVMACDKHFPGHGDTAVDSHKGLPVVNHTQKRLSEIELIPFKEAIKEGVAAIMTAHILVPAIDEEKPATLSPIIINKLLRDEMQFNGLIVSDALDMEAITQQYSPEESTLLALKAGCDLLVAPVDVPRAVDAIEKALESGQISMQMLDEKVARILAIKQKLIQQNSVAHYAQDSYSIVNNRDLEQLSKTAYQKAITLIQNKNVLPLTNIKNKNIMLVDVGLDQESYVTEQIKQEFAHHATFQLKQGKQMQQGQIVQTAAHVDLVVINVFGLTYAKPNYGISTETQEIINQLLQSNQQVTIVLFGNPYAAALFKQAPALLVAYEDHPYAQEAVANILLGKTKPQGHLPVDCSPSFKMGGGLSYIF